MGQRCVMDCPCRIFSREIKEIPIRTTNTAVTQRAKPVGIILHPCGNQYQLNKNKVRKQLVMYHSIGKTGLVCPATPPDGVPRLSWFTASLEKYTVTKAFIRVSLLPIQELYM